MIEISIQLLIWIAALGTTILLSMILWETLVAIFKFKPLSKSKIFVCPKCQLQSLSNRFDKVYTCPECGQLCRKAK